MSWYAALDEILVAKQRALLSRHGSVSAARARAMAAREHGKYRAQREVPE